MENATKSHIKKQRRHGFRSRMKTRGGRKVVRNQRRLRTGMPKQR